jgi:hypothetical protein
MKYLGLVITLFAAAVAMQTKAEPVLLSSNADQLRELELNSIPPWPQEIVLSGTNEHSMSMGRHCSVLAAV